MEHEPPTIKRANEQSPTNEAGYGKIICKGSIFNCHASVPEANQDSHISHYVHFISFQYVKGPRPPLHRLGEQ